VTLVATARRADNLPDLAERFGDRALSLELEVSDAAACVRAIDKTVDTFERLDVLVNNAVYGTIRAAEDTSIKEFQVHPPRRDLQLRRPHHRLFQPHTPNSRIRRSTRDKPGLSRKVFGSQQKPPLLRDPWGGVAQTEVSLGFCPSTGENAGRLPDKIGIGELGEPFVGKYATKGPTPSLS
jgi:hypothetical protein